MWAGGVDRPTYIYIFCDHKKATKKAILGPPAITSNTHILLYRYEVIKLSLNMLLIYMVGKEITLCTYLLYLG